MSRWSLRRRRAAETGTRTVSQDQEVARLTAKADLIVEELDLVVQQMGEMLRGAYGTDKR